MEYRVVQRICIHIIRYPIPHVPTNVMRACERDIHCLGLILSLSVSLSLFFFFFFFFFFGECLGLIYKLKYWHYQSQVTINISTHSFVKISALLIQPLLKIIFASIICKWSNLLDLILGTWFWAFEPLSMNQQIYLLSLHLSKKEKIRLCLITIFVFYLKKLVLGNIKKKKISCIF